jgi:hypothetical protein
MVPCKQGRAATLEPGGKRARALCEGCRAVVEGGCKPRDWTRRGRREGWERGGAGGVAPRSALALRPALLFAGTRGSFHEGRGARFGEGGGRANSARDRCPLRRQDDFAATMRNFRARGDGRAKAFRDLAREREGLTTQGTLKGWGKGRGLGRKGLVREHLF